MNLWLPHREANITHEKSWYSILSPPPFGIDKSVTIHHFSSRIECDQTLQFAAVCVCENRYFFYYDTAREIALELRKRWRVDEQSFTRQKFG